jgi:adenosylcobinamide kinase / adenosylcobinamide-phosphate guanylyltransferase
VGKRLLILGGTRSGKSRYAFERTRALEPDAVAFIATARAGDPELDARIALHRAQRPATWRTLEVERDLAGAIRAAAGARVVLLDSLTLWAATVVEAERSLRARWEDAARILADHPFDLVVVSEEAGLGTTPMSELARRFLDELGWLNQQVAALCDEVRLMVAGIPVPLKGAR